MRTRHAQSNVVYMNYFILLGLIFLGFVFVFSTNFSNDSADQLKEHLADNIFARIEKATTELKAIESQSNTSSPIKIIAVPRRIGDSDYNIIGKNQTIAIQSAGKNAFYTTQTLYWDNISYVGASNSQNSEIKLLFNVTANQIVIS